jgi:hypothetical protein
MTSKIKVDNIENQCGGAVVTKCGGTTTISGTVVKSNTLQASDAGNIISQSGTTITLGASGDTINLASGASQSGFGRTGTVDWITTPKTTGTFTAVSGEGYFLNTSGGVITANLPAGVAGAIVSFADYAATWQTNKVTVTPNGTDKIGSQNENASLNTEGQSVTFVYVDSTQGWINTMDSTSNVRGTAPLVVASGGTITTDGNFKIHTFNSPGTFTVCSVASCASNNVVDYVVVAGGAGGGTGFSSGAGAGGAGGFRYYANTTNNPQACGPALPLNNFPSGTAITVTATSFPITVGAGGAQAPNSPSTVASNGVNSTFGPVTSTGGGGGGSEGSGYTGNDGGSGGGNGNTPSVSPAQGTAGGNFGGPSPSCRMGGGGGGAIQAGFSGSSSLPSPTIGNGGAGAGIKGFGTSGESCGSHYFFSGGGGGQSQFQIRGPGSVAQGGIGGGGNGSEECSPGPNVAEAGTANTGGGAGGAIGPVGQSPASNGGSGIVIIRYKFQ